MSTTYDIDVFRTDSKQNWICHFPSINGLERKAGVYTKAWRRMTDFTYNPIVHPENGRPENEWS